jgi:DNA-binding FrmR family transcriptional regulator
MDGTTAGVIRRLQASTGMCGIQRMVDEDQYCIDVIKQIDAVQPRCGRCRKSSSTTICIPA